MDGGDRRDLIIISNRLPITCKKSMEVDSEGCEKVVWNFSRSSGGLVAALSGLGCPYTWIGWPGFHVQKEEERRELEERLMEHGCIPVWLDEKTMDDYYNGFSNGVLWPLFHYLENFQYHERLYAAYKRANQAFADAVVANYKEGALVWVHDYHLMLMPRMFRDKVPNAKMGFFLHIPFPSSELYKILPVREEVLLGVLNCDMIGFHTYDYARHFMQSCTRILGLETSSKSMVFFEDRAIPVGVFPVGIDPNKFLENLKNPEVQERINELERKYEGKKVLLGVDRLDYIKGVPQKLQALDLFFEKYPDWIGKVVLIQVAVPSREDVSEYQKLKREVDELVTEINSKYGTLDYHPIRYLYHSVQFNELTALYAISDACIITSLRDGMNLVCQEYISCQQRKHGTLILSEFAGAAQSLSASLRVNPWRTKDVAAAILKAITLPAETKKRQHELLFKHVMQHTASDWGMRFIAALKSATQQQGGATAGQTPGALNKVFRAYHENRHRLVVLSYDGTLVPFEHIPSLARPTRRVLDLLQQLIDGGCTVVIISGRDKPTMDEWFSSVKGLILGAEHGYFFKMPDTDEWEQLIDNVSTDWKAAIRPILKHYTDRTPGSSFEEKEVTFTWHYRFAGSANGAAQACDLQIHLESNFGRWPIEVVHINKTIEIRPNDVNPTKLIKRVLETAGNTIAFVLYIGDSLIVPKDLSARVGADDLSPKCDMFTCAVGRKRSGQAEFHMSGPEQVLPFLERLSRSG